MSGEHLSIPGHGVIVADAIIEVEDSAYPYRAFQFDCECGDFSLLTSDHADGLAQTLDHLIIVAGLIALRPDNYDQRLKVAEHRLGSLYLEMHGGSDLPVTPLTLEDRDRFTKMRMWVGRRLNWIEPADDG